VVDVIWGTLYNLEIPGGQSVKNLSDAVVVDFQPRTDEKKVARRS
jgi:hypothetical protein